MPRMEHQKLKLLYLSRILLRETDENHPMTITRMMDLLRLCGVEVRDRKSLYSDLEALGLFGLDILSRKNGRSVGYFIASREFELPELRLLVDAVQSSRFVTRKKTDQLISKLETLCSAHQAGELQREVFVSGRVKTMNESIYYSVDAISAAIAAGERITFRYFSWRLPSAQKNLNSGSIEMENSTPSVPGRWCGATKTTIWPGVTSWVSCDISVWTSCCRFRAPVNGACRRLPVSTPPLTVTAFLECSAVRRRLFGSPCRSHF